MSLYEALTLVAVWCGGQGQNPRPVKIICQQELLDCLVLDDTAIDRKNVIGCFRKTKIV